MGVKAPLKWHGWITVCARRPLNQAPTPPNQPPPNPRPDGDAGAHGEALRALLLWHDAGASARALGFGLYLILLVGSLPRGLDYLQATSALPGAALLVLAYNVVKGPVAGGYARVVGVAPDAARASLAAAEARAAARAGAAARDAAAAAAAWAGGALSLAGRALRGRSPTGTAATFTFLWTLLLLSELRLVPQLALAMLAYASLFAAPWAAAQFRAPLDGAVRAAAQLLMLLFAGCDRGTLALAAGAGAAAWQAAESGAGASLVVRATCGAAAALGVVVWRTTAA
jgi:hypothetical protein